MLRRGPAFLVSLLLLVCIPAPVCAEEPLPVTEDVFAAQLEKIRGKCKRGRCKQGLGDLKELLATHEKKPWVSARRADLLDLTRRLAFGAKFPAPDPDELVSGKIKSYNPRTGRINISYKPAQMKDWIPESGLLIFPARMSGPFTVKIKGRRYPSKHTESFVFVMGEQADSTKGETQLYQILFGSPTRYEGRTRYWLPPKLIIHEGDDKREIGKLETMPLSENAKFELEVKATATKLTAKVNRKKIADTRKPKELYGSIGFQGKGFDEIKIDGHVEPAWIQGLLDEIAEGHRDEFEADFDPADHLPAWVLDGAAKQSTGTRQPLPAHPTELDAMQKTLFDTTFALLSLGAGLDVIDTLPELLEAGLPKGAVHYLEAHAEMAAYDLAEARKSITKCRAFTQDFARAELFEGLLLTVMGNDAEARPLIDGVIQKFEAPEDLYRQFVFYLMRQGRPADARKVTAVAARHGVRSTSLDLLNQALLKSINGPDWRRVYEVKTKNYHVLTDIDRKTARAAANTLEAMNRLYQSSMENLGRDETRLFKVYLFSGRSGFLGYLGDLKMFWGAGGERAAGVYSPLLKQLLIWNLPVRDEMMKTVRHEGFHQFFDRYLPHAPVWFNEGLAEFYENSDKYAGKPRPGLVAYRHVQLLRKQGLMPVKELFETGKNAFYVKAPKTYAMSWLLVHMLRKGPAKHRAAYKRLIEGLEKGSAAKAMAAAFPESSYKGLDIALRSYLANLAD